MTSGIVVLFVQSLTYSLHMVSFRDRLEQLRTLSTFCKCGNCVKNHFILLCPGLTARVVLRTIIHHSMCNPCSLLFSPFEIITVALLLRWTCRWSLFV